MTHPLELLLEIVHTSDEHQRHALIEAHRRQIDDSFLEVVDRAVEEIDPPATRLDLATMYALTLVDVVCVDGKRGDVRTAKKLARHCLGAHLRALRLFGEIDLGPSGRTKNLIEVLLAAAGELRKLGLEEEGWQAYWIADPILSAEETVSRSGQVSAGKLLVAGLTLERVGMRELAGVALGKAREKVADGNRFEKERALAERLVDPLPADAPPAVIYSGDSMDTAYRFTSLGVSMTCLRQTRCPRCRGAMRFASSTLVGAADRGKTYSKYQIACEDDAGHPVLTVYSDLSLQPGGSILARAGQEMSRLEEKRLTEKHRR